MRELQAQIIREMGVKPNMTEEQAREEVECRIQFIYKKDASCIFISKLIF